MKVYVIKEDWEWFKEMKEEARGRDIPVRTFPLFDSELNREIELELSESQSGKDIDMEDLYNEIEEDLVTKSDYYD